MIHSINLSKIKLLITSAIFLLFISCSEKTPPLLTEKIEYDVSIKNDDENTNWWVQNLEGATREKIVNVLVNAALSGKYKVYDYDNNLLDNKEIELIFKQPVSYTLPSISNPDVDSVINTYNEIDKRDICKIIFLEKWYFDEKNLNFSKKITGYGPVIKKYTVDNETGEKILKGYMPLFWIYLDDSYPSKLKN